MILHEAKGLAMSKGIQNFKGGIVWVYRFMKRQGLLMQNRTRLAQKIRDAYEDRILNFHRFVIQLSKKKQFPLSQIGNLDETPLTFECPSNLTVELRGMKTVAVKTSGNEKNHFTVVLACIADGTMLQPLLILKRKMMPKDEITHGILVHCHVKGWMDEDGMKLWFEKVWARWPEGLQGRNLSLFLISSGVT